MTDELVFDAMAQSTVDTRGFDLYPSLFPENDTVIEITSVTVARVDGLPLSADDLTVTPSPKPAPWISPNAASVVAMAVNWWQGVGAFSSVSLDGNPVSYLLTASIVTAGGRKLSYSGIQIVYPSIS